MNQDDDPVSSPHPVYVVVVLFVQNMYCRYRASLIDMITHKAVMNASILSDFGSDKNKPQI